MPRLVIDWGRREELERIHQPTDWSTTCYRAIEPGDNMCAEVVLGFVDVITLDELPDRVVWAVMRDGVTEKRYPNVRRACDALMSLRQDELMQEMAEDLGYPMEFSPPRFP